MNHLKISNFFKNNSSTILTVVGSIGVGVTAIMSARDTIKAHKRIQYERGYQNKEFNTKEKIKIAAPCYIPTVISGISTILCICGANKINKDIQKSLTGAYLLLDQSYKEYRKSVKEVHGEDGELNVVKNIVNKKAEESHITKEDDVDVFFDFFGLQFFYSRLSTVYEAEKAANELLRTYGYVSMKTVCALFGEDVVATDNLLGWSLAAGREYGYDSIELEVTRMPREDGSEFYIIDFVNRPTEDYLTLL